MNWVQLPEEVKFSQFPLTIWANLLFFGFEVWF